MSKPTDPLEKLSREELIKYARALEAERKGSDSEAMIQKAFRMPRGQIDCLDELVEQGVAEDRSGAVRKAVDMLLEQYGIDWRARERASRRLRGE